MSLFADYFLNLPVPSEVGEKAAKSKDPPGLCVHICL